MARKITLKDYNQAQAEEIKAYRDQNKNLSRFEAGKKWIVLYAAEFRKKWLKGRSEQGKG